MTIPIHFNGKNVNTDKFKTDLQNLHSANGSIVNKLSALAEKIAKDTKISHGDFAKLTAMIGGKVNELKSYGISISYVPDSAVLKILAEIGSNPAMTQNKLYNIRVSLGYVSTGALSAITKYAHGVYSEKHHIGELNHSSGFSPVVHAENGGFVAYGHDSNNG